MNEKDLLGKSVVSMGDGARVGKVKDLIFRGIQLHSLVLRGEKGEGLLPYERIGKNGPDAITIESYTMVDWNVGKISEPETREIGDLRKLSVVDSDGKMLGHLHDLELSESGLIQEVSVQTEGVFGIGAHKTRFRGSQIRAMGPKLITVDVISDGETAFAVAEPGPGVVEPEVMHSVLS
jgi:sporulation protein YlmC with PRC-barrel domain